MDAGDHARCSQVVGHHVVPHLASALLQLEERAGESAEQQQFKNEMGQTLHVLSLFCAAQPSLLVPHIDVLAQFLNYEHATKAVGHICEMLPPLLHILDHPPSKLMESLEKLTVKDLREMLRQRELPVSGKKAELIQRLRESDALNSRGERLRAIEPL